jgi:hypothetical protein
MRLMWRLLTGDKRNRCRLQDNNFVVVFDAVTHRANANSRTNRDYRLRSRLLTRLREEQGTQINYATTEVRVMQKNNRFMALNNCVPAQPQALTRLENKQSRPGGMQSELETAKRVAGQANAQATESAKPAARNQPTLNPVGFGPNLIRPTRR